MPLIMPANATPILGTVIPSHAVGGVCPPTHCPLPQFSLAEGGLSHSALFAAMRPPPAPAISQGRAQCPLYMRLHDGSAGALLSPQAPN